MWKTRPRISCVGNSISFGSCLVWSVYHERFLRSHTIRWIESVEWPVRWEIQYLGLAEGVLFMPLVGDVNGTAITSVSTARGSYRGSLFRTKHRWYIIRTIRRIWLMLWWYWTMASFEICQRCDNRGRKKRMWGGRGGIEKEDVSDDVNIEDCFDDSLQPVKFIYCVPYGLNRDSVFNTCSKWMILCARDFFMYNLRYVVLICMGIGASLRRPNRCQYNRFYNSVG